jgi:hypothetical protein
MHFSLNAPTGGTNTPTIMGENTEQNPTIPETNKFACKRFLESFKSDAPRNPKNAAVLRKCNGEPATERVMVSDHVRPAYLGPNKMHIGQKKNIPNKTPEQMEKHMINPKFERIRIVQNAAVGTEASNDVPAALMMVGPRCDIAASTRFDRLRDLPVRIVSDKCRQ